VDLDLDIEVRPRVGGERRGRRRESTKVTKRKTSRRGVGLLLRGKAGDKE